MKHGLVPAEGCEVGRECRDVADEQVLLASLEREAAVTQPPQQPVCARTHPIEQSGVERVKGALRVGEGAGDARDLIPPCRARPEVGSRLGLGSGSGLGLGLGLG